MNKLVFATAAVALFTSSTHGESFGPATKATNEFGIDLYRKVAHDEKNICLSPYSISCALAMALDGADGETRREMASVLHLDPKVESDSSFAALQELLGEIGPKTARIAGESKRNGGPSEPITIAVANRLFAQAGYEFRPQFFAEVKENFGAAPEVLDFVHDPSAATKKINDWVAQQTHDRIRDLIPEPLVPATRLVLTNAPYLKAPWASEFSSDATKPEPFHIHGRDAVDLPAMQKLAQFRYAKRKGFSIVALPYSGDDLQFVVLIPDKVDGLGRLESS